MGARSFGAVRVNMKGAFENAEAAFADHFSLTQKSMGKFVEISRHIPKATTQYRHGLP